MIVGHPADIILVDIDGTLTDGDIFTEDRASPLWGNGVLHCIADHYARQAGLEPIESQRQLRAYADAVIFWDYPDFIAEFGVDPLPVRAAIAALHARYLRPRPDAVTVVRALSAAGKTLCIMSNNPVAGCLWKLRAIGLADEQGAPLFRHIFGANLLRGQKSVPLMWRRAIAHLGVPGERIATIGDNPVEDGQIPRSEGIGHTYIVPKAGEVEPVDGVEIVRHLRDVLPILLGRPV